MQALERCGIFRHIDYLSTVSGGGFIGSTLSALMSSRERRGFPLGSGADHKPTIEHLRNNSNYLTPQGLIDIAQIAAVLARGILLNLVVLAPWMFVVCAIVTFLYGPQLWEQATNDSYFEQIDRHLSRHMDRNLEGEKAVEASIRALDLEGLVRPEATAVEARVRAWLRGEHDLDGLELDALMNSSGLELVTDAFANGVTRTDVARRLWQANLGEQERGRPLLSSLMALEEIDGIVEELAIDWEPENPEMVRSLARALREAVRVEESDGSEARIPLLYDPWLHEVGIIQTLVDAGLVDRAGGQTHYRFVESDLSMARVILELYAASFFSPRWFEVGSWYASNWSDATYLDRRPYDQLNRQLADRERSVAFWDPKRDGVTSLLEALVSTLGPLRYGVTERKVATVLLVDGLIEPAIGRGRFHFTLDSVARPAPEEEVHPRRPASRRALVLSNALSALFDAGMFREELSGNGRLLRTLSKADGLLAPAAAAPAEAGDSDYWTAEERAAREYAVESVQQKLELESVTAVRPLLAKLRAQGLLTAPTPSDEELLDLVYLVRWSSSVDGALFETSCEEPPRELFSDGLMWGQHAVNDPAFATRHEPSAILAALYDLGLLRPAPAGVPQLQNLVCVGKGLRRTAFEVFAVERAVRAAGLGEPFTVAALLEALGDVEGLLRPLSIDINVVRELYDRKVVGLGDTHESYRVVHPERQLWEYLLVLYEGRHFRRAWFEEADPESEIAYREDDGLRTVLPALDPLYIRHFQRFEGLRQWTAESFRLPATGKLAKLALWWTLAFPLVILLGKLLPTRRSGIGRALRSARGAYERSFALFVIAILVFAFIELQPYAVYRYHWASVHGEATWSSVVAAISLAVTVAAGPALAVLERFGRRIALVVVGLLGPLLPYIVYLWTMEKITFGVGIDEWAKNVQLLGSAALFLVLVFLGLALGIWVLSLILDVNSFAFHGFYRDRIARAYLVRRENDALRSAEELRLGEICLEGSGAPYHLINVALNLQASGDRSLRERASDFFLFSRLFTGGERTGYCRTEDLERVAPRLRLAGAMAVSGAAVTPNMGAYSSGALAPLMALLNVRLGLWVPHPRMVRRSADYGFVRRLLLRTLRLHPGPGRLMREIRSGIDDSGALVYLSDGGHLENTGAFELLRRRCRLIVVGDAEADPRHNFSGLASLMRYARLDLGVEIDVDLAPLRLEADGVCERHAVVGRIHYPATAAQEASQGLLIYIKSSVTGDEDEVVTEYRARCQAFPHESTADQFFGESQFEAYRDLGDHAARSLFELPGRSFESPAELIAWLEEGADAPRSG
jgi:hypothetical protein